MDEAKRLLETTTECLDRHFGAISDEARTRPILAAVSGGRDSSLLAWLLAELRRNGSLSAPVLVGHVDHGIHSRTRRAAATVRALCADLDLRYVEHRLTGIPPREDAMRRARYAALQQIARAHGATAVLTAHHADDNVETVLFRMLRGTGHRGLAGIPEARPLDDELVVLRPLLQIRRAAVHRVHTSARLPHIEDPTNADTRYRRNWLRTVLIPKLRRSSPFDDASPRRDHSETRDFDETMLALARTARAATTALDDAAAKELARRAHFQTPWRCELRLDRAESLGEGVLQELLCQAHARLHPDRVRPPWTWVRRACSLLEGDRGRRVADKAKDRGVGRFLAERTEAGLLIVDRARAVAPPTRPIEVPEHGSVRFGATEWMIRCAPAPPHPHAPTTPRTHRQGRVSDRAVARLDPNGAPRPWRLRARRAGDRFWPLGAAAPVALRRFLQNRRVPRFDRSRMPLLVDAKDRILWVPGVEIADPHRIRSESPLGITVTVEIVGSARRDLGPY